MLNIDFNHFSPQRLPIAILGVPFDSISLEEAVALIDQMVSSRRPHYVVTANVDFVTQAQTDIELHRILIDAHLVLCDGTPLVWASRFLGNQLPERVAGSDIVPRLLVQAAEKGHRVFLLGATPDSAQQAVNRLQKGIPGLAIAGQYSPPFGTLFQMDHREIRRRVAAARADLLFVAFGCPKAEKWIAMNYRSLGVPVVIGIGATIDFLAGKVKRAPRWMQRAGLEWLFRLAQEPSRLAGRYAKDLWVFGRRILAQWTKLRAGKSRTFEAAPASQTIQTTGQNGNARSVAKFQGRLNATSAPFLETLASTNGACALDLSGVQSIDSTGVALLMRLRSRCRAGSRDLILASPSRCVTDALALMRLQEFFAVARDVPSARALIEERALATASGPDASLFDEEISLHWPDEVTAQNVGTIFSQTRKIAELPAAGQSLVIDLSSVNFIDSAGLMLMLRVQQLARRRGKQLVFGGAPPIVRNALREANLDQLLLERPELFHLMGDPVAVA